MVAGTGCELHLVEPLGFDLSEPKLRRAGLDYHDLASVTVHDSLTAAWAAIGPARVFAFTAHAQKSYADISYQPGDVLLFGPEPTGLDQATLADPHITARVRIPMLAGRRSLNLSNAAAVDSGYTDAVDNAILASGTRTTWAEVRDLVRVVDRERPVPAVGLMRAAVGR